MAISALSSGLSVEAGQNQGSRARKSRPKDDPLAYLTPSDWRLVSHAVGFSVNPSGKLFPLLAFQIGWDRQSAALTPTQNVTITYLSALAAPYRDGKREDLGMMDQIAAAIKFLESEEGPRLDVLA